MRNVGHYRIWFRETLEIADLDFPNHWRYYDHIIQRVVIYKTIR
jgi:hypothetical protein